MILSMLKGSMPETALPYVEEFFAALSEEHSRLLAPARVAVATELGVGPESLNWGGQLDDPVRGRSEPMEASEAFAIDGGLMVVTAMRPRRGVRFRTEPDGTIGVMPDAHAELEVTIAAIASQDPGKVLESVIRAAQDKLGINLESFKYTNNRFDELRTELVYEDLPGSSEDITIAEALSDKQNRLAAIAIKSSRGMLTKDLDKLPVDAEHRESVVYDLLKAGVLCSESVVVCSTSQTQVARVPDSASLSKLAKQGLRCACGKSIDEETPEDLLTITGAGSLLLDKSRWMSVLVREELVSRGVDRDDILLECQLDSDEIDCVALLSGEVTIFELKDKVFSVGNAYSFGAKIGLLNADHAVIVTTEEVSADVKTHFSRARGDKRMGPRGEPSDSIHYVEGADFREGIREVASAIFRKDGHRLLTGAMRGMAPDPASLLEAAEKRKS